MERSVHIQRTAQASRPIDQLTIDFHRSNQNGSRKPFPLRHDIKTMIHPINEIHVREAGRAEHDIRSSRSPFRSMARFVFPTDVGFNFDDPAGHNPLPVFPHKIFPNQSSRHGEGGSVEKRARNWIRHSHVHRWLIA